MATSRITHNSPDLFEEIGLRVQLPQYLELIGRKRNGRKWQCPSPEHADSDPSAIIARSGTRVICFGCGFSGDTIDIEQARAGGTLRDAALRLAQLFDVPIPDAKRETHAESVKRKNAERIATAVVEFRTVARRPLLIRLARVGLVRLRIGELIELRARKNRDTSRLRAVDDGLDVQMTDILHAIATISDAPAAHVCVLLKRKGIL